MAMLAEPRRKQKWSLNPRGKEWSEDSNKFGQKMLEKMGWSSGKGLGATLSGMTEHVKVSYKLDSKGVGFKDRGDQWTEHEDNFSALLSKLGGSENQTETKQLRSLEEKSSKSRARVHYHKFTRGKDLARYSEKDLANIFGRKKLKKEAVKSEEAVEGGDDSEDARYGVETIKGGSMVDYFKKKLPMLKFGGGGFAVGSNGVLKKEETESESELNVTSGFGFGFQQDKKRKISSDEENAKSAKKRKVVEEISEDKKLPKETFVSYLNGNKENVGVEETTNVQKKKKKKVKNCEEGLENPCFNEMIEEREVVPSENPYEVIPPQKKKKKKNKSDIQIEEEETNKSDTPVQIEAVEETPSKKKKKKQSKLVEETEEVTPKKKKSSKREVVAQINFNCIEDVEEVTTKKKPVKNENNEILEETEVVTPKKKTSSTYHVEESSPKKKKSARSKEVSQTDSIEIAEEAEVVTPKKKKSSKHGEEITPKKEKPLEIVEETEQVTPKKKRKNIVAEEEPEVVTKKKKSKKDNTSFEEETPANPYEVIVPKKKKKKSKKKNTDQDTPEESVNETTGMDNPALNLTDNSLLISDDLVLNIISEPVKTTPIIKRNPPQRRKSVRFSDVNQERIIPNNAELRQMEQEAANRNELLSINEKVIENGLEEQRKKGKKDKGFVNNGFDIKTVDNVSFYNSNMEMAKKGKNLGVVNVGFKNVQENVQRIDASIDNYQAEVENGFNEAKLGGVIGETGGLVEENARVEDGVRLCYKEAKFSSRMPHYMKKGDGPKAAYKQLIRGDIVVKFKEANLHEVKGYAYNMTRQTLV